MATLESEVRFWLALACVAMASCGLGPCVGGDKVDRLISQLRGGCFDFACEPGGSCEEAVRPSSWIRNPKQECVWAAARCLGEMGPGAARAVPALIEAVHNGPNNYDTGDGVIPVRDGIVEALGRTGDPRALPVLLDVLAHPKRMDAGPGASTYASKEPVGEEAALEALRRLGTVARPAVASIVPYLGRPVKGPRDGRIVHNAAAALGAIGDESAIAPLIDALDRKEAVSAAAEALGAFGPAAKSALPALRRLVEAEPDGAANFAIRHAVQRIAGVQAMSALPASYDGTLHAMYAMTQRVAKARGVKLRGAHFNSPGEELAVELRSGARVRIGFDRRHWIAKRVARGEVSRRRGESVEKSVAYEGMGALERVVGTFLD